MKIPNLLLFFLMAGPLLAQQAQPILGEMPQKFQETFLPEPEGVEVEVWVDKLHIPWSLAFLPNGDALVAQRTGEIMRIPKGSSTPVLFHKVSDVSPIGDAGLMGMALHPEFESQPFMYLMYTYGEDKDRLTSKVIRMRIEEKGPIEDIVIVDKIPAFAIHLGGRIAFGPDGHLYIGTGDLSQPFVAQDLESLASKILRVTAEGDIPEDNPFPGSPIYSYGHRVVQGFAWHPETGTMFNSEHGPSGAPEEGGVRYRDEVNVVHKGKNYGWPHVVGAPGLEAYEDPILSWNQAAFPPAGMAFHQGDLFLASLAGQALLRIRFEEDGEDVISTERWFSSELSKGTYGRFRDVTEGPDGYLYVCTSNTDGRAALRPNDDKILRIKWRKP
ncbi:PQQ-dependent sugar dehydrogenase [Pararhodonellum marinum]|uniref:PQQ-dependent sugar dehydrogenase n=1 Tax=Pararhodonellum marinum TaxID=2755358 RepID=UPI00188F64B1|nr:PQQ-dependent sugar dehydrogenase [Pararhodonellum marinum]